MQNPYTMHSFIKPSAAQIAHSIPRRPMIKMPSLGLSQVWDRKWQGINTRLQDKDLLTEINKQLSAMKKDGTYKKLAAKWFGS